MKRATKIAGLVLGLGLVALGSVNAADADSSEGASAPGSVDSPAAPETPETPAASGNPSDLLARAKASMATVDSTAAVISRMLRDARNDKDVVKVLCLDDKLNQIDSAKRSVAERVNAMEAAIASGSTTTLEFDAAVVGAMEERANALSAEAQQCIGEEAGIIGGSKLEVKIDPNIPMQDTSSPGTTPLISVTPTAASPTF